MKYQFQRGYISLFFVIILYLIATITFGQSVELIWTVSEDPNISYYGIYRTTHLDSSFTLIGTVNHPDSTYIDEDIQLNTHYYYAATSIDIFDSESGFSNFVEIETTPTPVELSVFKAHTNNNDVVLEWSTETESSNYGFEIQRNQNEIKLFQKIGFVSGNGTTTTPNKYSFIDENLSKNKYYYRLKQIDYNGDFEFSNVVEISVGPIEEFRLYQNYPNPFNPTTTISYSLPQSCHVELKIYNINGQEVYKLVDEFQEAGFYDYIWEGIDFKGTKLVSGWYFYRLRTTNNSIFRRMILLK